VSRIIVDSREQKGYGFADSIRKKLEAGDYSVEGKELTFALERKSLEDWVSTVVHSRKRFAVELEKLRKYEFAAIIIEGSIEDIMGGRYRSKITPAALLGITTGIMVKYSPVHVIFAGDRPHAYAVASQILRQQGGEV
jgi:ERCC4-type nuclease